MFFSAPHVPTIKRSVEGKRKNGVPVLLWIWEFPWEIYRGVGM